VTLPASPSGDSRYFDGQTAGEHAVMLSLLAETLCIQFVDGSFAATWPLDEVDVSAELPGGRCLLAHGAERIELCNPDLVRTLTAAVRRRRRPRLALLAAGAVVAAVVSVAALHFLPDLAAPLLPASLANGLGTIAVDSLFPGARACTGQLGQQALDGLAGRLAAAGHLPGVRVTVLDVPVANAMAVPGGRVVVLRGLIERSRDDAMLAGVLAHEIGHELHHDPERAVLRQLGLGVFASLVGADLGRLASTLVAWSYSRAAEDAADAAALDLLRGAGLRADGLSRFLQDIARHGEPPAWLSDHPDTASRIRRTATGAAGREPLRPEEWAAVQAICRATTGG
jgi:predicted Zn-dependent protease